MEIIKPGNLDRMNKAIIFTCPHCDCIFKATKDEYHTDSQYNEFYYTINCPFCGNRVSKSE